MINTLRFLGGVIGGAIVAFVLVVAVEFFSAIVHPFPEDFGGTPEEMREHVARYPQWVLAVVVFAWGVAAFASTWTANRIGGRGPATVIAALLVAAVVFNVYMLPYPMWFKFTSVLAIAGAAAWACLRPSRVTAMVPEPRTDSTSSAEPGQTGNSDEV